MRFARVAEAMEQLEQTSKQTEMTIKSPVHTCAQDQLDQGLALRFPRFQRWRSEKAADQATHTSEVLQMYRDSS